jgi:hypothetical protein
MNTIALPKSTYSEILKRQARTDAAISKLRAQVEELLQNELKPSVVARIERQSRMLDAGKGIKLKNMKEYRSYVRSV